MSGKFEVLDVAEFEVPNRLLVHAVSQIVIPRVGKSITPTFQESFYCWCAMHCLALNLPFIIMSHICCVISNKKFKLPYGMMITLIVQ